MEQYAVAPSDISTYQASASGMLSGTDEEKSGQIAVQKWLMFYKSFFVDPMVPVL